MSLPLGSLGRSTLHIDLQLNLFPAYNFNLSSLLQLAFALVPICYDVCVPGCSGDLSAFDVDQFNLKH